jgi:hypothetical protein
MARGLNPDSTLANVHNSHSGTWYVSAADLMHPAQAG